MEFINYKTYGKCAKLSKGGKTMLVTVDLGPRVIFYGMDGGENIFYEDEKDLINKGGEFFDKNLAGKGIWHIYGGHRLWKSPEYIDTYYPDNSPRQYLGRRRQRNFHQRNGSDYGNKEKHQNHYGRRGKRGIGTQIRQLFSVGYSPDSALGIVRNG